MTMVRGMWGALEQHWSVRNRRTEAIERLEQSVGTLPTYTQHGLQLAELKRWIEATHFCQGTPSHAKLLVSVSHDFPGAVQQPNPGFGSKLYGGQNLHEPFYRGFGTTLLSFMSPVLQACTQGFLKECRHNVALYTHRPFAEFLYMRCFPGSRVARFRSCWCSEGLEGRRFVPAGM